MSEKKPNKGRKTKLPKAEFDPRNIEQMLSAMGKVMEESRLESPEEINAFLREMMESGGGIPAPVSRNAVDRAQDMMYKAWEARGAKRVQLARKALEISSDCADAYNLLAAEAAQSLKNAKNSTKKVSKRANGLSGRSLRN